MVHLEAQLESIRCRRAALETRRAGYDAENASRAIADLSPSYDDAAYGVVEAALDELAKEADGVADVAAMRAAQGDGE
ncbi:hypothetical protein LLG88_12000 [bacterium]|nr:hypothetical protein [bacterium]